jgi:hypothetical protein
MAGKVKPLLSHACAEDGDYLGACVRMSTPDDRVAVGGKSGGNFLTSATDNTR